ncbi:MAG: hypothetical protein NTU57_02795 [Candidatus Aenigmarchaeota archaeon]|nr:hypothetical protein [Candidatus Aenigmarchaeota archaeon]
MTANYVPLSESIKKIRAKVSSASDFDNNEMRLLSELHNISHGTSMNILNEIFMDLSNGEKVAENTQRVMEIPWLSANALSLFKRADMRHKLLRCKDVLDPPVFYPSSDPDMDDYRFITESGLSHATHSVWGLITEYARLKKEKGQGNSHHEGVYRLVNFLVGKGIGKNKKWMVRVGKSPDYTILGGQDGSISYLKNCEKAEYVKDTPAMMTGRAKDIVSTFAAYDAVSDLKPCPGSEDGQSAVASSRPNPLAPLVEIYENGFMLGNPKLEIGRAVGCDFRPSSDYIMNEDAARKVVLYTGGMGKLRISV